MTTVPSSIMCAAAKNCAALCLLNLVLAATSTAQNVFYNFESCLSHPAHRVRPPQDAFGATVVVPRISTTNAELVQCSAHFQVPHPDMMFMVRTSSIDNSCSQTITVKEITAQNTSTLLTVGCGSGSFDSRVLASPGAGLWVSWLPRLRAVEGIQTGPVVRITITAVLRSSECPSTSSLYFPCASSRFCIAQSLVCDGVAHCPDASDESDCAISRGKRALVDTPAVLPHETPPAMKKITLETSIQAVTTTTMRTTPIVVHDTPTEDTTEVFQEVDMVSIIVVGVLFVVILLICIILACRSKGGEMEALSEESNQLRLDLSTNPGTSNVDHADGAPITPPPTYSMIERQTSYVSQISMSSSQVSVPPDYEEALELDEQGNPRPRRTSSNLSNSRHSSTRGIPAVRSASGYARSYQRRPRCRRSQSDSSDRPRFVSQNSAISEVGPIEEHVPDQDNDNLFVDVSPDDVNATGAGNPPHRSASTPSGFQNAVTSTPTAAPTPHLESGYNIEMTRDDSTAPLFHLSDSPTESDTASASGSSESTSVGNERSDKSPPSGILREGEGPT